MSNMIWLLSYDNAYLNKVINTFMKPLTILIPYNVKLKYEEQKNLEYIFKTKDGLIQLSRFALQHSDFYTEQCEGLDIKKVSFDSSWAYIYIYLFIYIRGS